MRIHPDLFGRQLDAVTLAAGLPISWDEDGVHGLERLTPEERRIVEAILAAHDPDQAPRRSVAKSLVVSRLTDAQLDAALALMTNRQKERWRSPGHPAVYADDPETVSLLQAIGADPELVLAPP